MFFAQFCFVVSVEIITDNSGTVTNIYTVINARYNLLSELSCLAHDTLDQLASHRCGPGSVF